MRAVRLFATFALAAVAVAACNAITGLGEDFVLASPDAGADGAAGDAAIGADGEAQDGARPDAAAGDAALDASTDAFSCDAANVVFCTDFESDAGWNASELNNGTVSFELDAGRGNSRAMHAHIDNVQVSRRAALWKRISTTDAKTYAHYDIAFDFRVSAKTVDYAALGILALTQQGGGLPYYGLAAYTDTPVERFDVIDDGPGIVADGVGVEDPAGAWHHAYLTYDRQASGTYDVEIVVDGTSVDKRSGFDFGTVQTAELRIGILFTTNDTGTMDLYVDNIVVRRSK